MANSLVFQGNVLVYPTILAVMPALDSQPGAIARFIPTPQLNLKNHGWKRMKMRFRSFTHWVKRCISSNAFIIRDHLCASVVELRFLGLTRNLVEQHLDVMACVRVAMIIKAAGRFRGTQPRVPPGRGGVRLD